MNTFVKIVSKLLIILLLSNCTGSTKDVSSVKVRNLNVDLSQIYDCQVWSNIIADIDYIFLETSESCVVGEIKKMLISYDRVIILTWDYDIFLFEKTGKLVKKLTNIGKGPLEFMRPRDLNISANGNLVVLAEGKIIEMNMEGLPISEYFFGSSDKISSPINIYWYSTSQIYTWHTAIFNENTSNQYHLYLKDSSGKEIGKSFMWKHFSYGVEGRFSQCGINEVAISPPDLNDTIFSIEGGISSPKFLININTNNKTKVEPLIGRSNDDFQMPNQLNKYLDENNLYSLCHNVVYNDDYLSFYIAKPGKSYRCFYNLRNNTSYVFNCYYDLNSTNIFYPETIYGSFDNKFYTSKDAWKIRQLLDKGQTSSSFLPEKRRLELLNRLQETKETDNPLIMIITTKTN